MRDQKPTQVRTHRSLWLREHARWAMLLLLVLSGILMPISQDTSILFPVASAQGLSAPGATTKPKPFNPHSDATSVSHPNLGKGTTANAPAGPPQSLKRTSMGTMSPGQLVLAADHATTFTGSDGKLEIDAPAGVVTSADLAAAGGTISLHISQIAPASGSSAGGGGIVSFGTYLVQAVDAQGVLLTHGLRAPLTARLRYGSRASALDLSHALVAFNTPLPDDTDLAPLTAPVPLQRPGQLTGGVIDAGVPTETPTMANSGFGAQGSQAAALDTTSQSLVVPLSLLSPSGTMTFNTDAPVATFGKPDPFNVDLNAGALTSGIPIDVPSGPGGLTPPVTLSYSSESVNEQHNNQGAAGWLGEGWNLDLGAISWAEHNSNASCTSGCGNGWEDTWELSDPFGTAVELIPPNIQVATYYDDTPNAITPSPVRWHTTPENYAKVYSYVSSLTLPDGAGVHPPCFRVFLTNGIMEEFGCTSDSLEYYYTPGMGDYISSWKLDLITDPAGNQIHITYTQDTATKTVSGVNHSYIRDAVLNTIEWDSPTCHNAQTACTGSSWAPQMRVSFAAAHAPTRRINTPTNTCNTGTHLRCDDPLDLSPTNLAAPDVQSTYALNDVYVQVRGSGTGSWNTLTDYQFSYQQNGPVTHVDPVTDEGISTAGYFLLSKLVTIGDDGATALPPRTFSYTAPLTIYYVDDVYHPAAGVGCGPAWNTGHGSGCLLWTHSWEGNRYYLATADNGMGLRETFTWDVARNNTHGVNGGGSNNADPLYCSHLTITGQSTYPCNETDDENWGRVVLVAREGDVVRAASGGNSTVSSVTSYAYKLAWPLPEQACPDCVAGMYWGNQNNGDYLDYYDALFMGFAETDVGNPDGSVEYHKYISTKGYGLYDATVPCLAYVKPCHASPWWDLANAGHGHEVETDYFDTDGMTLLKQVTSQYQLVCPPTGISGSPSWSTTLNGSPYTYTWDGKLVAALDHGNPVAVCDIQTAQVDSYTWDGASAGTAVPQATTTYTYDALGRVTTTTTTSNDGGATGSPTTIVDTTDYIQNDAVTATSGGATGTYLLTFPADSFVEDSGATTHASCSYIGYDGAASATGQQSTLTKGLATTGDQYTSCGNAGNGFALSGQIRTTSTYDAWGNRVTTTDPDANAGDATHKGCTVSGSTYTACLFYDSTFDALPSISLNALNQSVSVSYGTPAASNGFGLWPMAVTDANGQPTTTSYDALGRTLSTTLPGETAGLTTSSASYTVWCAATGAQAPCVEVDSTQRLDSGNTVTSRSFYNGYGRLVETRTPAPGGQDIVQYAFYDPSGRQVVQSVSYFVTSYTGAPGAAAFATPDTSSTQKYSQLTYTSLLAMTTTDPLGDANTASAAVVCSPSGTGDTACYAQATAVDALNHKSASLSDALGRTIYTQTYSGNGGSGGTYAVYTTTRNTYDLNGQVTQIIHPDGTSATTFSYDNAGRTTGMSDPDRGSESYQYDANGNVTQTTDARGSSGGTIYAGYDGLDRQLWRNTSNSQTGAYVTYSYDSTTGGNYGVGRLTGETFSGGGSLGSGSYSYSYDLRGQATASTLTVGGNSYPVATSYNDAGQALTLTYPTGETVTAGYSAAGWLGSLTRTLAGNSTTLLDAIAYTGSGGAAGQMTSAHLGNGTYSYSASFDALARPTDLTTSRISDSTTLFEEAPTYDAVGNISGETLTLPTGTDVQAFCYDEQNRLTWAGSTGTPPCTGTAITSGTLSSAQYTQTFSYDTLNRLTSGPLGSYTYGDSAHLHAATTVGTGSGAYTAAYDASGNMVCRAPDGSVTCSGGSPTGQQLTWDNEGRLTAWQNAPASPTSTDQYLYDGEGNRVEQQVTTGGTTTTTIYVGDIEQVATTGGTTTTTTYYYAAGQRIALAVNGTLSYLASDLLGSATVALNTSGTPTASQLYAPYGGVRYSNGTMPTDYGFTGQRADVATGLDYYGARYYDPTLDQFTSADTVLPGGGFSACGLNRYGYVKGNPETLTDPSGNCPQRAPTGWLAKLKKGLWLGAYIGLTAWKLVTQGVTPTSEALGSQNTYGTNDETPQVQSTLVQKDKTAAGPGGDCDDDGIHIPPETEKGLEVVGYSALGRVVAKLYQDGRSVVVNRAARRHPQPGTVEAREAEKLQATQTTASWVAHFEAVDDAAYARGLDATPARQHLIDLNNLAPWSGEYAYAPYKAPVEELSQWEIKQQEIQQLQQKPTFPIPGIAPDGVPSGAPAPDVPWWEIIPELGAALG